MASHKYTYSAVVFVAFVFWCLFSGCRRPKEETAISIHRFEQVLFSDKAKADLYGTLKENEYTYRFLLDAPLEDTMYFEVLAEFANDSIIKEIYDTIQQYYADISWLEKELAKSVGLIQKDFPDYVTPSFYTLISGGFHYLDRITVDDSIVAISLDSYVSEYFKKYGCFGQPLYIVKMLNRDEILPDCIAAIGGHLLGDDLFNGTLIDLMVRAGKILCFMDEVLPKTENPLKIRYTKEQYEWCVKYESQIWAYLIEKDFLFEADFLKIRHLINEGPTTNGFQDSPARLGEFIGWQMVKKYKEKKSVTMQELFAEKNSQKILSESGYKPTRN